VTKDERYFNEPHKFNPDRWKKGSENIHPFALLPFGFGPRACWGRDAMTIIVTCVIIHLVHNLSVSQDYFMEWNGMLVLVLTAMTDLTG